MLLCLMILARQASGAEAVKVPLTCTYDMRIWNSANSTSSETVHVSHAYSENSASEVEPVTGCTVCLEDQVSVRLGGLPEFMACRKIAPGLSAALQEMLNAGEALYSIRGYMVVKSRGALDSQGNRTVFSDHSFGIALDINREQNGLYDNCPSFSDKCLLLLGGAWEPGRPGTLTPECLLVRKLQSLGFNWGGQLKGKQKDFMHFSLAD